MITKSICNFSPAMIIGQISKQQAGVEFRQRIDRKNVKFEVKINNLRVENTLTEYNRVLTSLMLPRVSDFLEAF